MRQRDRGDQPQHDQREIFRRPELQRRRASGGAKSTSTNVATVPAKNEPSAAVASAGRPALPRHLVAVDGRHRGRRFARQVDQDRRGRAAVLRAVIDAGEHDQRGDRLEAEGDRQQHGDGRRRADARQHADHRAEQHADEAAEDIDGLSAVTKPSSRLARSSIAAAQNLSQGPTSGTGSPAPRRRSGCRRRSAPTAISERRERRRALAGEGARAARRGRAPARGRAARTAEAEERGPRARISTIAAPRNRRRSAPRRRAGALRRRSPTPSRTSTPPSTSGM